jgi:hypothetical protein
LDRVRISSPVSKHQVEKGVPAAMQVNPAKAATAEMAGPARMVGRAVVAVRAAVQRQIA